MKSHVQVKALLLLFFALHHSHCLITIYAAQLNPMDAGIDDITHEILMHEVAPMLNTTYLSRTDEDIKNKYNAIIWGNYSRLMVAMPVKIHQSKCSSQTSIIFRIDTGCPITTLTKEAIETLFLNCPNIKPFRSSTDYLIDIAGSQIAVTESDGHFQDVNILGTDFMALTGASVEFNYWGLQSGTIEFDVQRLESQEL